MKIEPKVSVMPEDLPAIADRRSDLTKNVHHLKLTSSTQELGRADQSILPLHDRNPQIALKEDADADLCAALLLPDEDPEKPQRLKSCGDLFLRRFRSKQAKEALNQAVSAYELALRFLPQDDEPFLKCLHNLSTALLDRFDLLGTLSDVNDAISKLEIAVSRTSDEHSAKGTRLNSLGVALARRFEYTKDPSDIHRTILNQQRAVELTAESHEDLPAWLNNIGISLSTRFQTTGSINDINSAISYQQRAVNIGPADHPDIAARLSSLGSSFSHRFDYSGDLSDISNAISNGQRSVQLTPDGHYSLPKRLNSLAISYLRRFNSTGDTTDLSNAVSNQERVVELTPDDDSIKSGILNNLGTMYQRRFKSTKELRDISNAISNQERAIGLTPETHSHLPIMLHNLGNSYLARFRLDSNPRDLSNAVSSQEKAVHLTPPNHPELPNPLNGLGNVYSRRFELTGEIEDLENSISCHERAVRLTPEGSVRRSEQLQNLGKAYLRRSKQTKDRSDIRLAISQYRLSATDIFGTPSTRLESAKHWAGFSRLTDPQQSFEAYGVAIDLISRVAGLDQTVQKRHTNLISISSLTTDAAASAFSMGKSLTALEWLEQGRCLVWNQLNQLRTPLDDLFAHDEALASRLLTVSKALENLGSLKGGPISAGESYNIVENNITLEDQTGERIRLAQKWDDLLAEVRKIPQFKDFLRPRRAGDLLENLPKIGFVVLVNVHPRRCDALLLHSGNDPVHVPLKSFSYKQAEALRVQLNYTLQEHGFRMREVVDRGTFRLNVANRGKNGIQNVLSELWKCVALPILAHINLVQKLQPPPRTRIWWCATGPLAFLPIHAAGIYSENTKPGLSLPSFAVSSYTPTLSSLVDRIQEKRDHAHNFLLISQPNTPGLNEIPGARQEVQALVESLNVAKFNILHLDDNEATIKRVKSEMIQHSWIHLACHADQDTNSPLRSGFHLHDGSLELGEIMKQQLPHADFAFLSACQTSAGDEKLSEEAVHLAAGMLAAGYRGVVSTMWSIRDNYGPEMAEEFYGYLFKLRMESGSGNLASAASAYALDYATHKVREQVKDSEDGLLTWVPYVHFGL